MPTSPPERVHSSEVVTGDQIVIDGKPSFVSRVLHGTDFGSLIDHTYGQGYFDQTFDRAGRCVWCGGWTPHVTPCREVM